MESFVVHVGEIDGVTTVKVSVHVIYTRQERRYGVSASRAWQQRGYRAEIGRPRVVIYGLGM